MQVSWILDWIWCTNPIVFENSRFSISLLKDLLNIPNSSAYKYWLVKVELCKILSQLPYIAMEYIVPQQPLQALAIEILINNLGDEDVKGNSVVELEG